MRSLETWPIKDFADSIDISRDTAKRLFARGIFPQRWISKAPSGWWSVNVNDERLAHAEVQLTFWKLYYRKPKSVSSLPSDDFATDYAADVIMARYIKSPLTTKNIEKFEKNLTRKRGQDECNETRKKITKMRATKLEPAIEMLVRKRLKFFLNRGGDFSPSVKDIAEQMECSVASLYRKPFGRGVLKESSDEFDELLSSGTVNGVENLKKKLGREPSIAELRRSFIITNHRATKLLAEWKTELNEQRTRNGSDKHPVSDNDDPFFPPSDNNGSNCAKKADEEQIRQDRLEIMRFNKSTADRKRIQKKGQRIIRWKARSSSIGNHHLELEAVPYYDAEVIRFADEDPILSLVIASPKPCDAPFKRKVNEYDKATSRLAVETKRIGIIYLENDCYISRIFPPFPEPYIEATCTSFPEIIRLHIENARKLLERTRKPIIVDWERLAYYAKSAWNDKNYNGVYEAEIFRKTSP